MIKDIELGSSIIIISGNWIVKPSTGRANMNYENGSSTVEFNLVGNRRGMIKDLNRGFFRLHIKSGNVIHFLKDCHIDEINTEVGKAKDDRPFTNVIIDGIFVRQLNRKL